MRKELEELRTYLTSPRLKAPTTITSYLAAAGRFLDFVASKEKPSAMDIKRYIAHLRQQDIKKALWLKSLFS